MNDCVHLGGKKLTNAAGYSKTNPSKKKKRLPKSKPYFFIYSPQWHFHNAATNHEIFPPHFAKKWSAAETRGRQERRENKLIDDTEKKLRERRRLSRSWRALVGVFVNVSRLLPALISRCLTGSLLAGTGERPRPIALFWDNGGSVPAPGHAAGRRRFCWRLGTVNAGVWTMQILAGRSCCIKCANWLTINSHLKAVF